jgi:HemY protein
MRRLVALAALVLLAVAAATVANQPGTVEITWRGWEIGTSVGVLIAALAVAAAALWLLFFALAGLVRLPRRFRRNRAERRRRAGDAALTRGMIALAAGDAPGAQRYARRAETLLGTAPLTLLLAAQAAQLGGDEAEARRRYTVLLDEPEGIFLGLRGLLGQALRDGDGAEALRLAARARELRPDAGWVFETLFALQIRAGSWQAACETLDAAAKRHLLPAERAAHHRGVIFHELSLAAERDGEQRHALSLAATAEAAAPDLAPLAARHARLAIADDRRRAARRAVERAWRTAPHIELAAVWAELGGGMPALELVTWFERLAAQNPDAAESDIAVAEAALAAQLWGEARRHLNRAIAASPHGPARRLCHLMARLEESEHPPANHARDWFDRVLSAAPDPTYLCTRCGGESAEWRSSCGRCQGFDTLAWRAPSEAAPNAVALPPAAPVGLPPLLSIPDGLAAARQSDT